MNSNAVKSPSARAETLPGVRDNSDIADASRVRVRPQFAVAAPGPREQGRLDAVQPATDAPLVAGAGSLAAG